ncbi:hypothetical protein SAMN06295888_1625 [Desulfonatronum zhilinae]|nr:hypothetical protein SAMN06295888_1625 [Desulfonatronum zhilinae]
MCRTINRCDVVKPGRCFKPKSAQMLSSSSRLFSRELTTMAETMPRDLSRASRRSNREDFPTPTSPLSSKNPLRVSAP